MKQSTFVRKLTRVVAPIGLAFGASIPAFATGTAVDVTAITASIAEQAAPVAAIGAAVLLLMVGIKAFKWVRKAF
jgi:hypothetical protein